MLPIVAFSDPAELLEFLRGYDAEPVPVVRGPSERLSRDRRRLDEPFCASQASGLGGL
jgi:hypothetical protein